MRRSSRILYAALPAMLLVACGGGGGGEVASVPPPPPAPPPSPPPAPPTVTTTSTPLPPTPALTAGTYDTLALVELRSAAGSSFRWTASPGEVRIKAEPATKTYTVLIHAADVPYPSSRITLQNPGFGEHVEETARYPDGRTETTTADMTRGDWTISSGVLPANVEQFTLVYDVGLSHVSYGMWAHTVVVSRGDGTTYLKDDPSFVYFVDGDRTAAGDIPVSGTARYAVHNPIVNGDFQVPDFILNANFGARSISALFDAPPELVYYDDGWSAWQAYTTGFHATGTAPFTTAGDFTIALSGALTDRSLDTKIADVVTPMTGALDGAFFGPQASQIGGVFHFTSGDKTAAGSFAGSRN